MTTSRWHSLLVSTHACFLAAGLASEARSEEKPGEARSEEAGAETVVRGVSWDVIAGGVPKTGALIQLEAGFSGLAKVAYHQSLSPDFSVGGALSLDYAYWRPADAFYPQLLAQVPIRYALVRSETFSIAAKCEPGLLFSLKDPFTLGLLLNAGMSFGITTENRMVLGGGIDMPLLLAIPFKTRGAYASLPVLFGPMVEFHLTPPLGVTLDTKIGPHITSDEGTKLGLRLLVGLAYRL